MPEANFQGGPTTIVGDLVLGGSLIAGAALVAVLHAIHGRRRSLRMRRLVS